MLKRVALLFAAWVAGAAAAAAHPHVWVKTRGEVLFDAAGRIVAVRDHWTFDDMYSSFVVQGFGAPGETLTPAQLALVAEQNMTDLKESKFFTSARVAGKPLAFGEPRDAAADATSDGIVSLHFTLPLQTPVEPGKALTLSVYDPSYFVDFAFADAQPVALKDAPPGCAIRLFKPKPLEAADSAKLTESFFSGLSPGTDFGIKMASRAVIACP